jgi:folate-dependent phosphoribosylglycinamide formyltransferase PurN
MLAEVADELWLVQECNTVFPGLVPDFFANSAVMQNYFSHVIAAEAEVFGNVDFIGSNIRSLSIKMGDLNRLPMSTFFDALAADVIVVFGASFIRAPLVDELVKRSALNIHMGISPAYRGSSCNFWAMYDRRPELVGATIHMLTSGLDSGPMLFHAFPDGNPVDPFVYGMKAVKAAHLGLVHHLKEGNIEHMVPQVQDKNKEIRYTRNKDFTDEIALEYLNKMPKWSDMEPSLNSRDIHQFLNPYMGSK